MKFKIDQSVFTKFPTLFVALPIIKGFDNTQNSEASLSILRSSEASLLQSQTLESLKSDRRVTSYLEAFKKFGIDPDKFKPAHLALSERVLSNKTLPDINPMVNLYNAMSIKHVTPFGGEDLDEVFGDFRLFEAIGDEQWVAIGGQSKKSPQKNELVWGDHLDLSTRALNWRQCDRTKMTERSVNGYFVMDGFSDTNKENILKAAQEFVDNATKLFGGTSEIFILDRDNPEAEIAFESRKISDDEKRAYYEKYVATQDKSNQKQQKESAKESRQYSGTTKVIFDLINQTIQQLGMPEIDFSVESPAIESHGDLATNVAMVLFPLVKSEGNYKSPRDLAEKIVANIVGAGSSRPQIISSIEIAGPGFINFTLNNQIYLDGLKTILDQKESYGKSQKHKDKKVIVEYSSPNIAKPFTVGHLRSTIIGAALANLHEATGWTVFRDNHLGDWGTQFGKQIYAIKTWGNESEIDSAVEPVKLLVELYVKFHEVAEEHPELEDEARAWFKKLETGDVEARRLWQKCIDWSWKEFSTIYKELGITFSENQGRGYGESYFEDKMIPIVTELESKGLMTIGKEGAKIIEFDDEKLPPLMILKKDGASLYATRDLATDKFRKEHYGDDITIINEVGIEQELYFRQLYTVEEMLGWYKPGQRIHVGHGHFRFADKKMSTRKGNVIWLKDVIAEAKKRASSEQIAMGAIKYNDLKRKPQMEIVFDWDELLNMQGNSGPYLQYTVARCNSLIAKSSPVIPALPAEAGTEPGSINPEELSLLRALSKLPEIIDKAASELSPHIVCEYCYDTASRFNTLYNKHQIIGSDLRINLARATKIVLENALGILGIDCPEKM